MAAAARLSRTFEFPTEIRSESSRQQHKQKAQRENHETLFKDCGIIKGKRTTTNLLFYTGHSTAWHSAIHKYFTHTTKRGIFKGRQIYVFEDAETDSENRLLTVNLYHNGTVMVQGREEARLKFEGAFPHLTALAECEKHSTSSANTAPPPSPCLHSTVAEIRNSLSLLEVELVELREHIHTHISTSTDMSFVRDQLSQITNQLKMSVQELKGDTENLLQEKEALKNELTNRVNTTKELEQIKQELKREIVSLKDDLRQRDNKVPKTRIEAPTKQLNTPTLLPSSLPAPHSPTRLKICPSYSKIILSRPLKHIKPRPKRLEQERVGGLVCRGAKRAAESFPKAKSIISTLLPHKDFQPATIQRINTDISRGCALLPNVHLAHQSTITSYHLHDHVQLNKHMIKEFARTLKDVAQGRHSYSVQQHRAESLKPQQHRHRYAAISPVIYKHFLRAAQSTSAYTPCPTNWTSSPSDTI
ncbi:hypothetical protein MHYP_G00325510 [Metynnis hypsauchen]